MPQPLQNNDYSGQFHSRGSQLIGSTIDNRGGKVYFGSTEPTQAHNNSSLPSYSNDEIDRACLRALRCPDSFAVKNRLKETKDKLLLKSIEWIFNDDDYESWQDGEDICLLWIKGGPGKGKTMMSIGLIEEISRRSRETTVVTYFFCQNADYTLNTVEAIIKGLILRILKQHDSLSKCLRDRWDPVNQRFADDLDSRENLWNVFLEMIDVLTNRTSMKVYVLIDALDECRGDGMANLLKAIVRTGLGNPSQVKWLLTSRPFDVAEQELLAGSEQVRVSLELNSQHISRAVQTYISHKMTELDRRWHYSAAVRLEIEHELSLKAEDTFLWVSLVCKKLDRSTSDQALTTIRDIPPDLHDLYHQAYLNLQSQPSPLAEACTNLLDVMMLTFRSMRISESCYMADLPNDQRWIEALIDQCQAFITIRGRHIEFVHQSARDYLTGKNKNVSVSRHKLNIHGEVALRCLSHLSRSLRQNLLNLSPDASIDDVPKTQDETVLSLGYASTFWFQHLYAAREDISPNQTLAKDGAVDRFLHTHLLEWLECLSILDQIPCFLEALQLLDNLVSTNTAGSNPPLGLFILDAQRFILRHHHLISKWPIQIYNSALIFSPETSMVRIANLERVPHWFTVTPPVSRTWTPLLQTLLGHSGNIVSLGFSSDGQYIASASQDSTVKVKRLATGQVEMVRYHTCPVISVVFSFDDQCVAATAIDGTTKVWDRTTAHVETYEGHSGFIRSATCSRSGQKLAVVFEDNSVTVRDLITGEVTTSLRQSGMFEALDFSGDGRELVISSLEPLQASSCHSTNVWDLDSGIVITHRYDNEPITALSCAPNVREVALGFESGMILVWVAMSGILRMHRSHSWSPVNAMAYSLDGQRLASGSQDHTVKVWDIASGQVIQTMGSHTGEICAIAFRPNSEELAFASHESITLWAIKEQRMAGALQDFGNPVTCLSLSKNGKRAVSGYLDGWIKVWDSKKGNSQPMVRGHQCRITALALSADAKYFASASDLDPFSDPSVYSEVKIWNTYTGDLCKRLPQGYRWIKELMLSPSGDRVGSVSSDKIIRVWDVATKQLKATFGGEFGIVSIAYSPCGRTIASEDFNGNIQLWDAELASNPSQPMQIIESGRSRFWMDIAHDVNTGPMIRLSFSPDGAHLFTSREIFEIGQEGANRHIHAMERSKPLYVRYKWIYCGPVAVLRLPEEIEATCHEANGNWIAIGTRDGRVLTFCIDRASLFMSLNSEFH